MKNLLAQDIIVFQGILTMTALLRTILQMGINPGLLLISGIYICF